MKFFRCLCRVLLAVASFNIKSGSADKRHCSLDRAVDGEWVNETYPYTSAFARSNNPDIWHQERCPWQEERFSCYFTDQSQLNGRGFQTENRKFIPKTCSYREFSPTKFLELMRGRTLLLCCDSLSNQMTTNLACSLHGSTTVDYNRSERFIYYPEYNFTLSNAYTNKHALNNKSHAQNSLAEYRDFANLRPKQDIMVINFGLHFYADSDRKLTPLLRAIAEEYVRDKDKLPVILWKETTPEHHAGYSKSERKECKPFANLDASYATDARVILAHKILLPVGIPIMYVFNATRTEWWTHVTTYYKESGWKDCVHFCDVAGAQMFIREVLYNHLVEIFSNATESQFQS